MCVNIINGINLIWIEPGLIWWWWAWWSLVSGSGSILNQVLFTKKLQLCYYEALVYILHIHFLHWAQLTLDIRARWLAPSTILKSVPRLAQVWFQMFTALLRKDRAGIRAFIIFFTLLISQNDYSMTLPVVVFWFMFKCFSHGLLLIFI